MSSGGQGVNAAPSRRGFVACVLRRRERTSSVPGFLTRRGERPCPGSFCSDVLGSIVIQQPECVRSGLPGTSVGSSPLQLVLKVAGIVKNLEDARLSHTRGTQE